MSGGELREQVACIQGHCMHKDNDNDCWYQSNWKRLYLVNDKDYDATTNMMDKAQDEALMQLIAQQCAAARKKTASDIFSLAHQYASEDKTMHGSEELRSYHYFKAIHKVGEFDGR